MAKTKYINSAGIAFSEEKDLRVLRKYAAKGWNVKRYKGVGYELEKGPAEDVIFNIDIRNLEAGEEEEYFELFRMGGWEHVCSSYGTHLFKAAPGTKKIYTDYDSEREKLKTLRASIIPVNLYCFLFMSISFIMYLLASGIFLTIVEFMLLGSIVLAVPCLMMLVSTTYRLNRLKS